MITTSTTITFSWQINGLGTQTDPVLGLVVTNVYYVYQANLLTEIATYEQSTGGSVVLPGPDPHTFVEFQNLTQDEVIAWVQSILGQNNIDAMSLDLERSIVSQQQAYTTNVEWQPLPWGQ